jgi:hypothetical protein
LLQDVEDIEIRVWVTPESQINLAGVLLRRITVDKGAETHVVGSQFEKTNC